MRAQPITTHKYRFHAWMFSNWNENAIIISLSHSGCSYIHPSTRYIKMWYFLSNICVRHIDATLTVDYVTANKEQRAKSDKGPCISVVSIIGYKTPGHDHKFNSYIIEYAQSWICWQWCWSHRRRYMESLQQSKWTGLQVRVTAVWIWAEMPRLLTYKEAPQLGGIHEAW